MNHTPNSVFRPLVLVCGAALSSGAAHAQPAAMAGQITQLSGMVTTQSAGGRKFKILAPRSVVNTGDTLQAEPGTYARLSLPDGRVATLGPGARVSFRAPDTLELHHGLLELRAAQSPVGSLSVVAGDSVIDASRASVVLQRVAEGAATIALRQQAYARAALASSERSTATDTAPAWPVWNVVTDVVVALNLATAVGSVALPPGLYVQVIDGLINVTNKAGSQSFNAGQFGFTPSFMQPPVVLPANPGIKFTPPPVFSSSVGTAGLSNSASRTGSVDCEVR